MLASLFGGVLVGVAVGLGVGVARVTASYCSRAKVMAESTESTLSSTVAVMVVSSFVVPSTMEAAAASRSFWVAIVSSMSFVAVMVVSDISPTFKSCRLGVATTMNTQKTSAKPSISISTDMSVRECTNAESFLFPSLPGILWNRFISTPFSLPRRAYWGAFLLFSLYSIFFPYFS